MASTKTIRFSLRENILTANGTGYVAQVHGFRKISPDELIDIMVKENPSITRQNILAVMDIFRTTVKEQLLMGYRVNTGICTLSVSIRGSFDSVSEEFSTEKHRICLNTLPANELKKEVEANVRTERISHNVPLPQIESVFDYSSNTYNTSVTSGYIAEIKGSNFRIDTENAEHGIFFVNAETGEEKKVAVINRMTGSSIIFKVPQFETAANCRIVLRCGSGSNISETTFRTEIAANQYGSN